MPREVRAFHISTPAGTLSTAPLVTSCAMPPRIVRRISIKVPPGPHGHLRFQIAMNSQAVIPLNYTEFIATDNESLAWDVDALPESGAWQVKSYNTGTYPHVIEVRFEVDLPPDKESNVRRGPLVIAGVA